MIRAAYGAEQKDFKRLLDSYDGEKPQPKGRATKSEGPQTLPGMNRRVE